MFLKPKRLLFSLIMIGLLAGLPGCFRAGQTSSSGQDTESAEDDDTGDDGSDESSCLDNSDCFEDDDDDNDDEDVDTDTGFCSGMAQSEEIYEVPSPPDGVAPDLQTICEQNVAGVESNRAARVTLTRYSQSVHLATGQVEIESELLDRILGIPNIRVLHAFPDELMDGEITEVQATETGFSFHLALPQDVHFYPGETEISIKITVELDCADISSETKWVDSTTFVHLCDGDSGLVWVSSGDECSICHEVCEMAPCSIPASGDEELTVLQGSPKVDIIQVAEQGRMVILFAEHRGTSGRVSYRWKASAGTLSDADQSGVVWHLPPDPSPHLLQVVVRDDHSAAVAALRWRHKV